MKMRSKGMRLRLTRRGRCAVTGLVAFAIVGAFFGSLALTDKAATAVSDADPSEFQYVTVSAGQSLWSIAETMAPGSDTRDVVAEVVALNALATAVVEPGQRLAVPLRYSDS